MGTSNDTTNETTEIVDINILPEVDTVPDGKKMMFIDSEDNSGGTIPFEKMRKQIADNATDPVARAQIANLAKLPAGSTTGDAELADIRVGANGKVYGTAGEAVRGQLQENKEQTDEAVASLNEALEQLPNYSFYKNYAFEKRVSDDFGNQANITLIPGLTLPIGTYYVYAKFSVTTSISNAYARMYVSQAKFLGNQKNINGSGDYVLSDTFTVSEEKEGIIRLDINQLDDNRHVHINSLIIVNFSDEVVKSIDFDDRDRKTICSFKLEKKYYPDNVATTEYVDNELNDLYNLPNYSFDKNYAYGIHSNDKFINGGNNLTVIDGIILPVGKYYIFAKIKIVTHTSDAYVHLYVQQANFNSDLVKVDGSGEYFLDGHFSIDQQAEGLSSVRIDFNQGDSSRSVDVESLFIVKDSNRIISAIKNDNTDREKVCSFVLEQEYYPINMATKEDIDTLKKEFLTEPEPLFDFVKDYRNRNYSICLIGDSTSDGKAGPAIGIYTALSQQQKSGELLDGVQVIDRGSNGSTAEAYIGSYSSNSGSLYNAIQDNADIYVVCLGINDVRQGLCTKETLKERISFIVNEILSKTKGRVILRTPNSLGNDDVSEQYIKPYTSAQKYTDILWEAYDELKNVWSCTRVRSLDMQTLIFGRKSVPSDTNFLMGDVLHPSSNQAVKTMNQSWEIFL